MLSFNIIPDESSNVLTNLQPKHQVFSEFLVQKTEQSSNLGFLVPMSSASAEQGARTPPVGGGGGRGRPPKPRPPMPDNLESPRWCNRCRQWKSGNKFRKTPAADRCEECYRKHAEQQRQRRQNRQESRDLSQTEASRTPTLAALVIASPPGSSSNTPIRPKPTASDLQSSKHSPEGDETPRTRQAQSEQERMPQRHRLALELGEEDPSPTPSVTSPKRLRSTDALRFPAIEEEEDQETPRRNPDDASFL
ncbi:hypothetical protein GGR54DRAFT_653871 [Hypoxylon sp. NC1633]|nr:hypothetical protein GGR54DRAFT_653871 [Hypoxylon sp. NC1633]